MKKLHLCLSAVGFMLLLASCSSSKEARKLERGADGNWQLQTITTEGITGKVKARVLDEADFNCFIGSAWVFNKANSLGSYTISKNGGECVSLKRSFRWSIYEETGKPKMLQYKKVDEKFRDIEEGKAGYRFTILTLDDKTMSLKSDITFEGRPASFTYNFVRN